jgi:hypothetical protein
MLPLRSWIVQECKKFAVRRQSLKDSDTLRRWDTEEGNQTDGAIDKVLWEQQARSTSRVGLRRYRVTDRERTRCGYDRTGEWIV